MMILINSVKCLNKWTNSNRIVRLFTNDSFNLPDRAFINIKGKDSKKFLQGICTNNVNLLVDKGDNIACAFLSTKGRIIADSFLHYLSTDNELPNILIETNKSFTEALIKHLTMYKLRSDVTISQSNDWQIKLTNNTIDKPKDVNSEDIRSKLLYHRVLTNNINTISSSDEINYLKYRYYNCIAEGLELLDQIPFEFNLDLLNYISFTKGCYLGQELIARTKFKGVIRKRLVPFIRSDLLSNNQSNQTFSTIDSNIISQLPIQSIDKVSNKLSIYLNDQIIGEVVSSVSDKSIGLVLIRLENINNLSFESSNRTVISDESSDIRVPVTVYRPVWWPQLDNNTGKPPI
mmetsp:Transcript_7820/g.6988  ORF Transcript_7820/g.6988 Transcript_7820/m.6988 type:complete len:347 (+) Transcript_7820:29-1069(+)